MGVDTPPLLGVQTTPEIKDKIILKKNCELNFMYI